MYRFFLALRYIGARPISWVSMIGIWITVTSAIVTLAIMTGYLREISRVYQGEAGDVVITPYPEGASGATKLPTFEQLKDALAGETGIAAMSAHLVRPVLLRCGPRKDDPEAVEQLTENNFGQMIGVDPAGDLLTTDFMEYVKNEKNVDEGVRAVDDPRQPFAIDRSKLDDDARDLPVALPGEGVFEKFHLAKGQVIELSTLPDDISGDHFEPLTQRFVIGGAVRCGYFPIDSAGLYVDLQAARVFAKSGGDATEICIRVASGNDPNDVAARIANVLDAKRLPARTQTWVQRHGNEIKAIQSQRSVLALLLFFFVLVACFNVFATMTILVSDKLRDIGTIAAMGASPFGILTVFTIAGFLMSFVSSAVGSFTGAFLAHHINDVHDWITDHITHTPLFKKDVYYFDRIPIELQGRTFPLIVAATVMFACICAAIPALRAARLDPVKALRQE